MTSGIKNTKSVLFYISSNLDFQSPYGLRIYEFYRGTRGALSGTVKWRIYFSAFHLPWVYSLSYLQPGCHLLRTSNKVFANLLVLVCMPMSLDHTEVLNIGSNEDIDNFLEEYPKIQAFLFCISYLSVLLYFVLLLLGISWLTIFTFLKDIFIATQVFYYVWKELVSNTCTWSPTTGRFQAH
jgi:hypothetical protein